MPRKTPPSQGPDLEDLVARIQSVNPTGHGLRRSEERARYAEKARLQSLLLETYPEDVRIRVHHDMPGIVSLSIPRLHASCGHAVVESLTSAARHWIEIQSARNDEVVASSRSESRSRKTTSTASFVTYAERHLAEYDFDCAIQTLVEGTEDPTIEHHERIRGLLLLLEIHVDHLANHDAALELEPALHTLGGLSERAHELLGIAASRAGDVARALNHLGKSRGERAGAEVVSLARTNVRAGAWGHARKALMHLRALAAMTEPPLATSLAASCDDVHDLFVREARGKLGAEIEADPGLERFVREFAPSHPWLVKRREDEHKARIKTFTRSALQKARDAQSAGSFDEVSYVLGTIEGDACSAVERQEIMALRTWADERRAESQANRALTLAQSDDLEAAAHAYVQLTPQARAYVRAKGSDVLFHAVEQLNEVFPEKANSRSLVRAAVAWTQAQRMSEPTSAWSVMAPHAGLLEIVATFAPYLHRVRTQVQFARALVESSSAASSSRVGTSTNHDVCIEGVCFSEWNESGSCRVRPVRIARHTLRIGPESFVVTLGQVPDDDDWILSVWPCRSSDLARHVRIQDMHHGRPLRIVAQKQRVVLLDEHGALWIVDIAGRLLIRRVHPPVPATVKDDVAFFAVDDEHIALEASTKHDEQVCWWVVHVSSGVVRAALCGRDVHCVRSIRGATFYRVTGLCLEKLDVTGHVVDHFELPKNVTPWALVDVPEASRPIILAAALAPTCVLAWWQPQPRFFRSFEVFDTDKHGEFVEAWALVDGRMFVMTQRKDGRIFLHEATMGKNVLRPGDHWPVSFEFCTVVHDPLGRRAWVVRTSPETPVEIQDMTFLRDRR